MGQASLGAERVARRRPACPGPWRRRPACQPSTHAKRRIRHGRRLALRLQAHTGIGASRYQVVVAVEPGVEAELPVEHERADDGRGRVASRLQQRRDGRPRGVEPVGGVLADAVMLRQQPAQDRRVRRKRQRDGSPRAREAHALGRQAVERRREPAPEPIGAQRVDGDEQDVRRDSGLGPWRRPRRAGGREDKGGGGERAQPGLRSRCRIVQENGVASVTRHPV